MNIEAGNYVPIVLSSIVPSASNPRKHFDDASMAELTASVREAGVQSPILLRRAGEKFEIVCGERRFRAATAAGLETIPAIVREMDDSEAYQAQIIENLQREGLGPMEEAESYAVLARTGVASVDIAAKVGKAASYVHQRMQLLKLVKKGKDALSGGKLMLGHALEVAKLNEEEQAKSLQYCLDSWQTPTLPQLRDWIQRNFRLQLSKAPFPIKDAGMHPTVGACVDCAKRTGADSLLFSDVKEGDSCLDAKCYGVKVETIIHVRVEELKKTQEAVPLLTHSYQVQKGDRAGALGSKDYELVQKARPCESATMGVMLDGEQVGRKVKVCLDRKCKVHHAFSSSTSMGDPEARKKQAAKDRRDTEVRLRTALAIVDAVQRSTLSDDEIEIDDALCLADYAFRRMDHAQDGRLAKVLGWERDDVSDRNSLGRWDMLSGMGMRKAISLGVLATVAGDLTVQHTYGSGKPEGLNTLAARHGVNVEAIAAAVDAEIKAKGSKKSSAKKKVVPAAEPAVKNPVAKGQKAPVKKLSAQTKKNIAAAIKKRWAATRKKGAKA